MNANAIRTRLQAILDNAGHDFGTLATLIQELHTSIQSHINGAQSITNDAQSGATQSSGQQAATGL